MYNIHTVKQILPGLEGMKDLDEEEGKGFVFLRVRPNKQPTTISNILLSRDRDRRAAPAMGNT